MPPPPQVSGVSQMPQSRILPQPSETLPQSAPSSAHVRVIHGKFPHLLNPPPPQKSASSHAPHSKTPPHESGTWPQSAPSSVQVLALQPPSPPPVSPALASFDGGEPFTSSKDERLHDAVPISAI